MSEPGPDSIPTSADPRSKRPVKRRAITAQSEQATQIEHLFRDPSKDIRLPGPSKQRTSDSLAPPPEIVANVQGSSAGAGSGEFHVYKASRRREYERLRMMQSEVDTEKANVDWEQEREDIKRRDQEKTEKNRKRREKRNAAKNKGKSQGGGSTASASIGKGGDAMAVDAKETGASGGSGLNGDDGYPTADATGQSSETPGLIIHDD